MKNTKSLIFGIVIAVLLAVGLATMFMPYVKITESDIKQAIQAVFEDFEDVVGEIPEDSKEEWLGSKTGVGIVDDLASSKLGEDIKQVRQIKGFILTCLIVAWVLAFAAFVLTLVLRKRARYIFTLTLSIMSAISMFCLFLFLPTVAKNKVVVAVEEQLSIDVEELGEEVEEEVEIDIKEALGIVGEESLRDTIITWIGEFVRELLNNTLTYGYWLYIALMGSVAIASICGIVLDKNKLIAKIYVLSGSYKGASIDVDSAIMVGRDPKICQLIMDGEQVSRKHCKISFNDKTGKYLVTDYSTNGTYYTNGNRLDENVTAEIDSGTIIMLGKNGDKLKLG